MLESRTSLYTATLAGLMLACGIAATSVSAADNWYDLSVQNGTSLENSLTALNEELQLRYDEDDRLAALADPRPHDFATTAIASSEFPEFEVFASVDEEFGTPINDGESLNANLDLLNYTLATLGDDLFLQIVAEATGERYTFDQVAETMDSYNAVDQYQFALLGGDIGFGQPVQDDVSLNNNVAGLNQYLADAELRDQLLAGAVPAVTGASMDSYLAAAHWNY
ncbi:hypothetical protein GCM10011352_00950 [Marinobacterium zhoushanense]|uniref:Uncharacterized protein n=1 Tax=Marinobacterium zhoushanense TaxID=1679163 RepID=A0ABQ1JZN7_9GAMM|nr:hypothetical protein [Marinobacterium zhoushanense]GGB79119.1 hypothetical protein GCM10011352_00950 [Marinobacterium zhoushanense]